jgi:predicted Zn-ribbon and HTH transcriptional regulator
MKLTRLSLYLLFIATASLLASCGSSSKQEEQNSDEFKQAEESLKDQIKDVVYNIPSPSEIPYLLQATGAEFNQSLLTDVKKVDQYMTRTDKAALNLGAYVADIGYLSSYDKTQKAIDYLGAARKLADNLGVVGSFDNEILKQFEANISNKDSLASLLNSAVQKTDKYLKNDSRNKLAAMVLTGSFIESLFISTGLIKTYPKDLLENDQRNLVLTPLIRIILQQEKSVDELVKMLSTVEQSDPVTTIQSDLAALQASYRALNIEEQIKNNSSAMVLSDKHLIEITKIVEKMRKDITD